MIKLLLYFIAPLYFICAIGDNRPPIGALLIQQYAYVHLL